MDNIEVRKFFTVKYVILVNQKNLKKDFIKTHLLKIINFNLQIRFMNLLDKIITTKIYYPICYILINIGFILSFITKVSSVYIDIFLNVLIIFFGGLIFFDLLIFIPKLIKWNLLLDKIKFLVNLTVNQNFIKILKILFFILIWVFPLILGLNIKYNPTRITIISELCYGFGFILLCSSIIKYGYISPNNDKRTFVNFLYGVLSIFVVINRIYPNILTKVLIVFRNNFMDIVVISLTFILMTATLGLLAFTYNMVLDVKVCREKYKDIGKDFFKSTVYIILFTIGAFTFFLMLNLFNITSWNSIFYNDVIMFVELNIVFLLMFCLAYLFVKFLENFVIPIVYCLGILKIDCF